MTELWARKCVRCEAIYYASAEDSQMWGLRLCVRCYQDVVTGNEVSEPGSLAAMVFVDDGNSDSYLRNNSDDGL